MTAKRQEPCTAMPQVPQDHTLSTEQQDMLRHRDARESRRDLSARMDLQHAQLLALSAQLNANRERFAFASRNVDGSFVAPENAPLPPHENSAKLVRETYGRAKSTRGIVVFIFLAAFSSLVLVGTVLDATDRNDTITSSPARATRSAGGNTLTNQSIAVIPSQADVDAAYSPSSKAAFGASGGQSNLATLYPNANGSFNVSPSSTIVTVAGCGAAPSYTVTASSSGYGARVISIALTPDALACEVVFTTPYDDKPTCTAVSDDGKPFSYQAYSTGLNFTFESAARATYYIHCTPHATAVSPMDGTFDTMDGTLQVASLPSTYQPCSGTLQPDPLDHEQTVSVRSEYCLEYNLTLLPPRAGDAHAFILHNTGPNTITVGDPPVAAPSPEYSRLLSGESAPYRWSTSKHRWFAGSSGANPLVYRSP